MFLVARFKSPTDRCNHNDLDNKAARLQSNEFNKNICNVYMLLINKYLIQQWEGVLPACLWRWISTADGYFTCWIKYQQNDKHTIKSYTHIFGIRQALLYSFILWLRKNHFYSWNTTNQLLIYVSWMKKSRCGFVKIAQVVFLWVRHKQNLFCVSTGPAFTCWASFCFKY